jgi:bis(5'-nucleosidyl)-tetraphosphatase
MSPLPDGEPVRQMANDPEDERFDALSLKRGDSPMFATKGGWALLEERSAGVVVYHPENGSARYLLLRNDKSKYDLPKGNIERGESELNAAVREAKEETGLRNIQLVEGFSEKITYFYLRPGGMKVHKSVQYYLGSTDDTRVIVSSEHTGFKWLTLDEALKTATYDTLRELLVKADVYRRSSQQQMKL